MKRHGHEKVLRGGSGWRGPCVMKDTALEKSLGLERAVLDHEKTRTREGSGWTGPCSKRLRLERGVL